MKNLKSNLMKNIDTLSTIATDLTGLGALLCTHYDHLAQNGYDHKELLFLCDSCGMLADNILHVCDSLLQVVYSPGGDNVVDIDKKPVDEGPMGA